MDKSILVMIKSLCINTFLTILKVVVGFIGNSTALVADGIHSLSDLVTDIFSLIGAKMALRPADRKHPFGHGKMEYIVSLGISCVVIVIGAILVDTALNASFEVPDKIVLFVSLFCIIVKYLLALYINRKGVKYNNNILIAGAIESKMDVYSSLVVLCSTILMIFSEEISILKYADKVAILLVAVMIIKTGIELLVENGSLLLEEKMLDVDFNEEISELFLCEEEVISIRSLHIFKYGVHYKLIGEVVMDNEISLIKASSVIEKVKGILKNKYNFEYIFIDMEPMSEYLEGVNIND